MCRARTYNRPRRGYVSGPFASLLMVRDKATVLVPFPGIIISCVGSARWASRRSATSSIPACSGHYSPVPTLQQQQHFAPIYPLRVGNSRPRQ